jgi:superoxide dismutase
MNQETYEALKRVVELLERYLDNDKGNDFGWKDKQKQFVGQVNDWIDEVAKEYEDVRTCHLCGSIEKDKYCTNETCAEYTRHETKEQREIREQIERDERVDSLLKAIEDNTDDMGMINSQYIADELEDMKGGRR